MFWNNPRTSRRTVTTNDPNTTFYSVVPDPDVKPGRLATLEALRRRQNSPVLPRGISVPDTGARGRHRDHGQGRVEEVNQSDSFVPSGGGCCPTQEDLDGSPPALANTTSTIVYSNAPCPAQEGVDRSPHAPASTTSTIVHSNAPYQCQCVDSLSGPTHRSTPTGPRYRQVRTQKHLLSTPNPRPV